MDQGDQGIRGEAPADIEQRCLGLCQDYIGGPWKAVKSTEEIIVIRITGGLTNQLYRVQLKEAAPLQVISTGAGKRTTQVFTNVAVKLYLPKHLTIGDAEDLNDRLNDNIVLTLTSQTKIGPHVLGIFSGGNIQAYYEV